MPRRTDALSPPMAHVGSSPQGLLTCQEAGMLDEEKDSGLRLLYHPEEDGRPPDGLTGAPPPAPLSQQTWDGHTAGAVLNVSSG